MRNFMALLSCMLISCSSANPMAIQYYLDCGNEEVEGDIVASIDGIKEFAKEKGIAVGSGEKAGKCGYILKKGGREKYIDSGMTDVDLMTTAIEFFQLEE